MTSLIYFCVSRIMVCIIFGLVLTSTIHEIWKQVFPAPIGKHSSCLVKESTSMKVLQCFSAVRNIKDWLTVKNVSADEINCLHGLRVISLLVTILIHTSEVVFVLSRPTSQEKLVQVSFLKMRKSCNKLMLIYSTSF